MTDYNLFPGATPTVTAYADPSVNVGTSFYTTASGWVTQIRYLSGDGTDVNYGYRQGALWQVNIPGGTSYTYTKLAGPFDLPSPTGPNQWVTFDLPTPYALTPGTLYRVAVLHHDGGYPATSHYFNGAGGDRTYGPVVVPSVANSLVIENMQGTFKYTASPDDIPDSQYGEAAYYADVTITDVNPSGTSIAPSAISSAEAFGTATVTAGTLTVSPSGIASAEAFGTAVVTNPVIVSPAGITSSEAFGTAVVTNPVIVSPAGITSSEGFGSHFIIKSLAVSPAGIASGEAIGSATVTSALAVSPNGVTSGEAFGNATIVAQGGPTQTVTVTAGIPGAEAVGTPTVTAFLEVDPVGIPSAQALGTPVVSVGVLAVTPAGMASTEAFGAASITQTVYTVTPAGIPSGTAFGLASVSGALAGHRVAMASLAPRRYQASIPRKEGPRG